MAKKVYSTDLIDRGYSIGGVDFLKATEKFSWGYHYQPTL
ncbi:hypothetical protein BACEGG_00982 [Bacteroides eggerthii DSM 20697]|nr:hypothetical protein BACEGG_00982 [Bacteroides eggerthii DSM 20697]